MTPQSSGRTSAAEIALLILNHYTWVSDQPVSFLCHFLPVLTWLLMSLVMGLNVHLVFRWFSMGVVFNLFVILMSPWEEASTALTYSSILNSNHYIIIYIV